MLRQYIIWVNHKSQNYIKYMLWQLTDNKTSHIFFSHFPLRENIKLVEEMSDITDQ
jgi:hypothetical protein